MLTTLLAIAPVFLVIVLGLILYRTNAMGPDMWSAFEHLCFYVLFPCLLIRTLATADFSTISLSNLVLSLILGSVLTGLLLIAARPAVKYAFGIGDAGFTSLFQGSTRWHGFIALAVVTALYGAPGIAVVAVAIAVLVPALNALNTAVLVIFGEHDGDVKPRVLRQIATNPFILAAGLGGLLNVTGIGLPAPIKGSVDFLAGGALGISLLTIGAGLRPLKPGGDTSALIFGVVFRLIVMPVIMYLTLTLFGIAGLTRTVAVICAAVPTASSSYVMARKMGGDAPLMANIITAQVFVAAVSLPIAIYLLQD